MSKFYFLVLIAFSLINYSCAPEKAYSRKGLCDKTSIFNKGTMFVPTLPDSIAKVAILVMYPLGLYDAGYVFRINGKNYRTNELGYCEIETTTENCVLINSWDPNNRISSENNEFIRVNNRGLKVDTFSIKLKRKHISYFLLCHYAESSYN